MKIAPLLEYNYNNEGDFSGRMHPALEDLWSMMRRSPESRDATWRRTSETEFEVRHYGRWEGDDGSGDYDWQSLSKRTSGEIDKMVREVEKKHKVQVDWQTGEKNWIYFPLSVPAKKPRAKSVDPNPAAGNRAQRVLTIVTNNPNMSRQELIQSIVRETGMTPAGAAAYLYNAKKALQNKQP